MSSRVADYDFELPSDRIALRPAERRESSRMMVLDRVGRAVSHRCFSDLPSFIRDGDLLVLNDAKVIPARLLCEGTKAELLLVEARGPLRWRCLVKPGRKFRAGSTFRAAGVDGTVAEVLESGERVVEFSAEPDLDTHGLMPLPPYMRRAADREDRERYQTVYARDAGAIAAPTAGLHFTREILSGLPHAFVTLHVGLGTFKPVEVDDAADHPMHEEWFRITPETAEAINSARRVIAVGTTSVRVIEAAADAAGRVAAGEGRTSIFIRPPYRFRRVGALLTNFHLPRSTLLMLVAAFAGREFVLDAYAEAVRTGYRFYSYGDCMFIE